MPVAMQNFVIQNTKSKKSKENMLSFYLSQLSFHILFECAREKLLRGGNLAKF